jgi:CBS domain-containing protein
VCCLPDTPLADVARLMVEHDCGSIPVVADTVGRKPVGIITDRDIVTRTLALGRDPMALRVRDCMTSPAVTIVEDAHLGDCVDLLERGQIRRAIVIDDVGRCIGIVAQADIAQHASKRETGDLVQEVSRPSTPAFIA